MEWSKLPEVTIQKGESAQYNGILIPDINYRNYKIFEELKPRYDKALNSNQLPSCIDNSKLGSPVIWGLVGIVAGAFAIEKIK